MGRGQRQIGVKAGFSPTFEPGRGISGEKTDQQREGALEKVTADDYNLCIPAT